MARYNYNTQDIINTLSEIGVKRGDTLFCHFSLIDLGFCQGDTVTSIVNALKQVLGPEGTFITPSYSYSFCEGEVFNPETTKSRVGALGNALISMPETTRSCDPIFSVVGFGKNIKRYCENLPATSFGKGCIYERLHKDNAKICNFGLSLEIITPIHYLEQYLSVPYRFSKIFSGSIEADGKSTDIKWDYFVRYLGDATIPNCRTLENKAIAHNLVNIAKLGLGTVRIAEMQPYFELATQLIKQDTAILIKGELAEIEMIKNEN